MRGLTAPVVVLLVAIGAVGCTSSPRPRGNDAKLDGYVSLSSIGTRCGLAYTIEGNGKGVLAGNGQRVVVQDGLAVAIVNGERVQLNGPVRIDGMDAKVPKDAVDKIAALVADARPAPEPQPRMEGPGPTSSPRRAMTIVIDPGHGGKFDGAKSRTGLEEKFVNLDVSRRLRDALTKMGFRVLMTRETDREVAADYRNDLDARVRLAERSSADLFISIHANANKDASIAGFEVYRARDEGRGEVIQRLTRNLSGISSVKRGQVKTGTAVYNLNRVRTAAFADEIRTSMRTTGIPDRGVRDAGFHVIKWAPCPAVLVEMDYLTNSGGAQRLGSASMRQRIADALAGGILRFAGRLDRIGVK